MPGVGNILIIRLTSFFWETQCHQEHQKPVAFAVVARQQLTCQATANRIKAKDGGNTSQDNQDTSAVMARSGK